jgi:hypothetical protein
MARGNGVKACGAWMLTQPQVQTPPFIAATGLRLRWDYIAIAALVLLCLACLLVGAGGVLRFAFPAAAFAIGAFLYARHPVTYIGFVWWLWFLTSLLSRLVDYQSGWDALRLMNVAPFLVTGLSVFTLWRNVRLLARPLYLPFLLVFAALLYGLGIGLIQNAPANVVIPCLKWCVPVLLGFHLAANWQRYDEFVRVTRQAFLWGVLLMGSYGIAQFLFAPAWDQFWLVQTDVKSFGSPEPLGLRVWSTMNSPGTFSMYLMAGVVLLFGGKGALRWGAMIPGYLSLLLTLARTAWGAWLLSVVLFILPLERRAKLRILLAVLLLGVCVYPLTLSAPFAELLSSRFSTFEKLEDDSSLSERRSIYDRGIATVTADSVGAGIGRAMPENVVDSALLDLLLTLGWLGAALYFCAIAWLLLQGLRLTGFTHDSMLSAARVLSISITLTLPITSQMIDGTGVLYWAVLAFPLAAQQWHAQNATDSP